MQLYIAMAMYREKGSDRINDRKSQMAVSTLAKRGDLYQRPDRYQHSRYHMNYYRNGANMTCGGQAKGKGGAEAMRIVEFKAENIARIKAVKITPDTGKNIVALTGKNRQGKTTILNAIWMALGGKDAIPSRPIRSGASNASVFLDMGEFTVTRRFTESGNSYLVVKNKDGFEAGSPQAFLSSRLGGRAQNPLEFMRLKPEDQVKALQKMIDIKLDREELARVSGILIAGIKCDDPIQLIDATYKHLFEQRTLVNAEVSRLDGAVKTAKKQIPPGKENTEKVSVAELFGERKALEEVQTSKEVLKKDIDVRTLLRQDWTKESRRIGEEIKEYERRVTLLQERMREITELHDRAGEAIDKLTQSHAAIADPDFTDIDARIAAADETNRLAILIDQFIKSAADLAEQKTKSSGMTERLQAIKDYKGRLIVEAGLPVEGLGFEAGEVTFNGIPLARRRRRSRYRFRVRSACQVTRKSGFCRSTWDGTNSTARARRL